MATLTKKPTSNAVVSGGGMATNPSNAYDGTTTTFGSMSLATGGNTRVHKFDGLDFSTLPNYIAISALKLNILANISSNDADVDDTNKYQYKMAMVLGSTVGTYTPVSTPLTGIYSATSSVGISKVLDMTGLRPGGGSWSRADLVDSTFAIYVHASRISGVNPGATVNARLHEIEVEVTYTVVPAAGELVMQSAAEFYCQATGGLVVSPVESIRTHYLGILGDMIGWRSCVLGQLPVIDIRSAHKADPSDPLAPYPNWNTVAELLQMMKAVEGLNETFRPVSLQRFLELNRGR